MTELPDLSNFVAHRKCCLTLERPAMETKASYKEDPNP